MIIVTHAVFQSGICSQDLSLEEWALAAVLSKKFPQVSFSGITVSLPQLLLPK